MMQIAICPNCGAELEHDECYSSNFDINFIANYLAGHCPTCKKEFQWIEVYDYTGIEGLEEVS